jgi:hypothetical protein
MRIGHSSLQQTGSLLGDNKPEPPRLRARLLVGGRIRADLTGEIPGGVQPLSRPIQPVIARTDAATWRWMIRPDNAGRYSLTLTFTPLEGYSDSALFWIFFSGQREVTATASQRIRATVDMCTGFLEKFAALLTALGISVGGLTVWAYRRAKNRRRKLKKPSSFPSTPKTASPKSDSPETKPATQGFVRPEAGLIPRKRTAEELEVLRRQYGSHSEKPDDSTDQTNLVSESAKQEGPVAEGSAQSEVCHPDPEQDALATGEPSADGT